MNQIDIYRAAHLLMKQFQEEAVAEAKRRSEALYTSGDPEGASVWLEIADAVEWLKAEEIPKAASVH